jgi:hypothetical protein
MIYPTVVLFLFPSIVLKPNVDWSTFDPITFDTTFRWKQDPLGGFLDIVRPIRKTIETRRGDCDDYAAVMASYFLAETDEPVKLLVLRRDFTFHVAVEANGTIYASDMSYLNTDSYLRKTEYHIMYSKTLQ